MTNKYYDCPIQAAYMAKEFGIKLGINDTVCEETGFLIDYTLEIIDSTPRWKNQTKFTIHPESLPIFEPQVGDTLETKGGGNYIVSENDPYGRTPKNLKESGAIILLRKNKQFFWPKEEV